MTQSNNILQELKELNSTLAGTSLPVPYSVPAGYFDELPGRMLNMVKQLSQHSKDELAALSPLLSSLSKEMPFAVPAGYFESFDTSSLTNSNHQSAKEELESISPVLNSISREMPYAVPAGYFDAITTAPKRQPAKVVQLPSRNWKRYAVAAIFIGVIATTVVLVRNNEKVDPDTNAYTWVEKKMKKVSTAEIENFIELSDKTLPQNDLVANTKTNEVKEMIKDIPVNEIEAFLNDIPQDETVLEEESLMN